MSIPPIAILGAGPSGLLLARLLHLHRIPHTVFERDAHRSDIGQGGTLDVHAETGQLALKKAGLLEAFKAKARYDAQRMVIFNKEGEAALTLDGTDGEGRPEIDRRDLRGLLLDSVREESIVWGAKVAAVRRSPVDQSMEVELVDGRVHRGFGLVVGADGTWTKARELVTKAKPVYSGYHYITAMIPKTSPYHTKATSLVGAGGIMATGSRRQIAAQRMTDDSYSVAIGLALPENWSRQTANAELLKNTSTFKDWAMTEKFSGWSTRVTDLIKNSEGACRAWPLYAMPVESLSWETVPGVALIGDAAHVSTPFAGEGVNCSLHDALQLAEQIVKHGLDDLTSAVSEYEKFMFPRAIAMITESQANGEMLFAEDAPRGFVEVFSAFANAEKQG
ncbi:hypothetical protein LTR78_000062 [Recurvomyces mirabilis]|uniref:FAD-binding domain-containing protein n=1 Tax=Recurvomyces mirabilis TaxID=574656 RepID=A0AAE1C687_9PEZI|nr:hypothetical protein LTR78_000062 [Recurvomyces mirabilis]KAK5161718.1 hypothetical protein LTS14_000063 [Recurvomyces mirabilis]